MLGRCWSSSARDEHEAWRAIPNAFMLDAGESLYLKHSWLRIGSRTGLPNDSESRPIQGWRGNLLLGWFSMQLAPSNASAAVNARFEAAAGLLCQLPRFEVSGARDFGRTVDLVVRRQIYCPPR
jgi:hypothetical protein